jgi:hypothetical protein
MSMHVKLIHLGRSVLACGECAHLTTSADRHAAHKAEKHAGKKAQDNGWYSAEKRKKQQ